MSNNNRKQESMTLQEYVEKKRALKQAHHLNIQSLQKNMQASKLSLQATLAAMRASSEQDFANMTRVNHEAWLKRNSHNVCRHLTNVLKDMYWDTKEFDYNPDEVTVNFDIDKENNQVTFHFTVKTVKH